MPPLLEVKGLSAFYGGTQALFGVDYQIEAGGITALLGANGAGKTTSLRAISRLVRSSGEIWFDGARIDGKSTEEVARLGIAHVPEGRGTFANLTVEENLRLAGHLRRAATARSDMDGILAYFPRLRERLPQQAGTLSGGEQQMLAISRALMLKPRLMLLDEPSFGLAPLVVQEIFAIMRRINDEAGVSILLVEQNATLALDLAGSAYLLETGSVAMAGSAAAIKGNEGIRRAYLGY